MDRALPKLVTKVRANYTFFTWIGGLSFHQRSNQRDGQSQLLSWQLYFSMVLPICFWRHFKKMYLLMHVKWLKDRNFLSGKKKKMFKYYFCAVKYIWTEKKLWKFVRSCQCILQGKTQVEVTVKIWMSSAILYVPRVPETPAWSWQT